MVGAHQGGTEARLRAAVAERVGEARFGLWFGEGVRLGVGAGGEALEVGVPNAFFREWIQAHFAGNLVEAAEAVTGRPLRLTFQVDDEAEPRIGHVIEPATMSFEDELPIGVLAVLPRHGCKNDPRIAFGHQAKIANDHRVSFPRRQGATDARKGVREREPGTLPRQLRLIPRASKNRHSVS